MGSKNRIHLGIIINFILHFHRNFYINTNIYMSKRVHQKIKEKHFNASQYAEFKMFKLLMLSTIGSCDYNKCENTINFIAHIEGIFILYSLKKEKHHTSCNTIYTLNKNTLKNYYKQESFKVIKKEYEKVIEEYLTN